MNKTIKEMIESCKYNGIINEEVLALEIELLIMKENHKARLEEFEEAKKAHFEILNSVQNR